MHAVQVITVYQVYVVNLTSLVSRARLTSLSAPHSNPSWVPCVRKCLVKQDLDDAIGDTKWLSRAEVLRYLSHNSLNIKDLIQTLRRTAAAPSRRVKRSSELQSDSL